MSQVLPRVRPGEWERWRTPLDGTVVIVKADPNRAHLRVARVERPEMAVASWWSSPTDNPVLWRRLELSKDIDHLRKVV